MSHTQFRYTESHEWIEPDGDIRRIGISDHAQHLLGDIVFVELPEPGRQVDKGQEFAVVESPKAAADVYAPVDCEIVEVNTGLQSEPGLINRSPYEEGWLVKIRLRGESTTEELMSHEDYRKFTEG